MESVTLKNKWLDNAERIAAEREKQNGSNNAPGYSHEGFDRLPLTSQQASLFAVVGELGGHLYFDVDPASTTWVVKREDYKAHGLRDNADLRYKGRKIEIRNCTATFQPIPIKAKDRDADAIVIQVYVEPDAKNEYGKPVKGTAKPTGKVSIVGWRRGSEFKPAKAKGDTYYALIKYDVEALMEEFE